MARRMHAGSSTTADRIETARLALARLPNAGGGTSDTDPYRFPTAAPTPAGGKRVNWSTVLKVAGPLGTIGGNAAKNAVINWRDEKRACESLKLLFHQSILDAQGQVREDRSQYETSEISFTLTKLKVDDLATHPVHHVEAINRELPGDNPKRVRYFGYDSAKYRLWLEKPTDSMALRTPTGWPVICPEEMGPVRQIDKEKSQAGVNWFDRPLTTGEKALWGANPFGWPAFGIGTTINRISDRGLVRRITDLLHEHCVQGAYQIPPERHRLDVDDLGFWLTPLKSAESKHTVLYYLVVLNSRLPSHPKRAVAFIYSAATRQLRWT
jgi:hypothetical protein